MIGKRGTEMEKNSDWVIHNRATNGIEFQYMLLFILVFRILANRGEFPEYKDFADQLELLPNNLLNAKKQFEPIADKIASQYAKEPYSIWIGGGVLWGEVYFFTMCVLEEFLWVRTKAVSSAEFFHGTFELVEEGVPVFLIKGVGKERELDNRVEEFCKQYTDKFEVIDLMDYPLEGIEDKFKWILSPTISSTLLVDRVGRYYEKYTGHKFGDVRYYKSVDY